MLRHLSERNDLDPAPRHPTRRPLRGMRQALRLRADAAAAQAHAHGAVPLSLPAVPEGMQQHRAATRPHHQPPQPQRVPRLVSDLREEIQPSLENDHAHEEAAPARRESHWTHAESSDG